MPLFDFEKEIIRTLYANKGRLNSTELLKAINERRKRKNQKLMSPTTFNKYIKILTAVGLVEKNVHSHKNVTYEVIEDQTAEHFLTETLLSLTELLDIVPLKLDARLDRIENRLEASLRLGKINDEQLREIKGLLEYIIKMIDQYLAKKVN